MTTQAFRIARLVVVVAAVLLNSLVYFYPDLLNYHQQCKWHEWPDSPKLWSDNSMVNSLPTVLREKVLLNYPWLQNQTSKEVKSAYDQQDRIKDINLLAFGDPQINGNWRLTKYIKRLDNYGNDYYLGHIYRTMRNRLEPTHVAVMGDLFSSQWILDSEFYNRTYRFVERLFTRLPEYKQNCIETHRKHENYDWVGWLQREKEMDPEARFKSRVYHDLYDWYYQKEAYPSLNEPLFINLTGNHDIGYSGDATWQHMARFHHLFGQNNYVINYNKGTPEEWRLVVLDSLTLEGPALQEEFVEYTWSFLHHLDQQENPDFTGSTVLLTHIPFYKREGLCRDGPEHRYYVDYEREPYKNGKLRSQNHLSYEVSQKVLNIVFPKHSKNGIILTGHDHEGCDSWYNFQDGEWLAAKHPDPEGESFAVREVVVRAMMGDFDGQTGLLTGHFDYSSLTWKFEFTYCLFLVQHWWWASKVSAALAVLFISIGLVWKG